MKPGHHDIYCGKAKWRVRSLQGSHDIEIGRSALDRFFADMQTAHAQLRGGFILESAYGFRLSGEITARGFVSVTVTASESAYSSDTENPSWSCTATFGCYAEDLQRVLEARSFFSE
jgi:hypothetical protein